MKRVVRPIILVLVIGLIFLGSEVSAIDIQIIGSWPETIDKDDLAQGPGSDLKSTYESSSGAVSITISGTTGRDDAWRVKLRRTDSTWNVNSTLFVKRTGDGQGPGEISGGRAYQAITTANTEFFTGCGDRAGIPLQFRLDGVSLKAAPPGHHSTTITYTVEDI